MLAAMYLPKTGKVPVHVILPCHFCAFRVMVYFLEPSHRLVDRALDVAAGPDHTPVFI